MGTRLMHRTTRSLGLTPAGAALAERAEPLLRQLAAVQQEVGDRQVEARGVVRLALPLAFGVRHVAPVLHDFCARHPEVVVDVSYTDAWIDLGAAAVDLAIRGGVLPDSSFVARRLRPVEVFLAASPAYLEEAGTPREPADLRHHRVISPWREPMRLRCGERLEVVRIAPVMVADSADARLQAMEAGLGIALLPDFVLADAAPGTVRLLPEWHFGDAGRAFFLIRPPVASPPAAVRLLADHLYEALVGGEEGARPG